jgi:hypothetical protein
MSESLHDLITRYVALLSDVDTETGEVPADTSAQLDALAPVLADKIEALAGARARLKGDAAMCRDLAKQYAAKAQARDNEVERIDGYALAELQRAGLSKLKAATATVWLQDTESVAIDIDVHSLAPQYQRTVTSTTADKDAIKKALKAGEDVRGAHLETRTGVRYK